MKLLFTIAFLLLGVSTPVFANGTFTCTYISDYSSGESIAFPETPQDEYSNVGADATFDGIRYQLTLSEAAVSIRAFKANDPDQNDLASALTNIDAQIIILSYAGKSVQCTSEEDQ